MAKDEFDELVSKAERQPFSGWDFSYLEGRYVEEKLPWDYRKVVLARMRKVHSMLDLGTGGGEFLSSLGTLPRKTFATEAYQPNVAVARKRLNPLGVTVVEVTSEANLPFEDDHFDLVIDRHESFSPTELFRIMKPGSAFVTQQVGSGNDREIAELFGAESSSVWSLEGRVAELQNAGFRTIRTADTIRKARFHDVGALVYHLKAVPWDVPDFSVDKYRNQLIRVHRLIKNEGTFEVTIHRCLIEALKPRTEASIF